MHIKRKLNMSCTLQESKEEGIIPLPIDTKQLQKKSWEHSLPQEF